MKKKDLFLVFFINFVIIPTILIITTHILFLKCNHFIVHSMYFNSFLLSLLIYSSFMLIIFSISKKNVISIITISIINLIIFIINQFKIIYEGTPLFISDFYFLGNGKNISNFIGNSLFSNLSSILFYIIVLIIIDIILIIFSRKIELEITSKKTNILLFSCSILILLILFVPIKSNKELYSKLFFLGNNYKDYNSYTTYTNMYSYYGIIGGIYNQHLESQIQKPKNYNKDKLNKILNNQNNQKKNNIGNPNIIVILSESFFDINLLNNDITFDKNVTKNFNNLKDEGYLVNMISPSYGGMTANVTYEFLTGGNMSFFSLGYIPFMQLYNDNNSSISITKDLSDNGYQCSIILGEDSYNSDKIYHMLGFENYQKLDSSNKKNLKGPYISDEYIGDIIIDTLEHSNKKQQFIMVETMQSHMDYYKEKYNNYDIKIKNSTLSEEDNNVILSYAQGIYDSDIMLKKVYDYIQNIDENTIIIFFGDHLPYLRNNKGENITEKLKYFNTKDDIINTYRLYNTQSLILSNYDLNLNVENNLGYDLLLTSIVNQMDVNINSYYQWLYNTRNILPTYNHYIGIDESGKIKRINDFNNNSKQMLNLRNQMIYKNFIDNK